MSLKYTHQEIDEDVYFPAGFYTPRKEVRLKHNGREVLYVIGHVVVECSCCGASNWSYALVPGYIVNWQGERNETGLPVSEIESITDYKTKKEIEQILQENEAATRVEFR